jgi:hypothetical protein
VKMKWQSLILTLLFSFHFSFAKNELLVLGGGGEPDGPTTIFDDSFQIFADIAKTHQQTWNSKFLIQKKHEKLSNIVKELPSNEFNPENSEREIKSLIEKMKTMQPGESVSVVILTHGLPAKVDNPTQTHLISASSSDKIRSMIRESVNLDLLIDVAKVAKEKSLKLAIVDNSCYSGSTQNLSKLADFKDICILSGSSKNTPNLTSFMTNLSEKLKSSHNFEEAFLDARSMKASSGYNINQQILPVEPMTPEISGPVAEFLRQNFFPELIQYVSGASDRMDSTSKIQLSKVSNLTSTDFYKLVVEKISKQTQLLQKDKTAKNKKKKQTQTEATSACPSCLPENINIDQLKNFMNHFQIQFGPDGQRLMERFEFNLRGYSALIQQYNDHIQTMTEKVALVENRTYTITTSKCKKTQSAFDKPMTIGTAEGFIKDLKNGLFSNYRSCESDILKNFELAKNRDESDKQKLQEEMNPLLDTFLDLASQITKVSGNIMDIERQLYDKIYRYFIQTAGSSGSSCADFHW